MAIAASERHNSTTLTALLLAATALAVSGVVFVPLTLTPYVIAAGLLVTVGMFTFLNTMFLLYFIVFTSSMAGLFRGIDTLNLGETALTVSGLRWVGVAGLGALLLTANAFRLYVPRLYLPFIFFSGWTALRAATSPLATSSLKDVLFYSMPLIVGLYALNILPKREGAAVYDRIDKVLLLSALVPALLYLALIPAGLVYFTENGPKGIVGPRPVALYLLVILALALADWRCGRTAAARQLGGFIAVVAVLTIFFTLSRMASLMALVLVALSRLDTLRPTRLALSATAVAALSLAVLLTVPPLRQRMFHQVPTNPRQAVEALNMSGRDKMWPLTFVSAVQRPVAGWGPGSARRLVAGLYVDREHSTKGSEVPPHNEYLQIFHDLGLIGLALALWAWLPLFFHHRAAWKSSAGGDAALRNKWNMAATLGILAVLLTSLVDNPLHYGPVIAPLFIIVGSAEALNAAAGASPLRREQG